MTGARPGERPAGLRALVVDDEAPAREELAYLLGHDERVGAIRVAGSAGQALKLLNEESFDVVFCDIKMPGLDGVELARVVSRFTDRPQVVFVTAYDDHAVDAFELQATDYVMKPVRADRFWAKRCGLALFYGGLAQLLAGMWEFVKGNTFIALAVGTFAAHPGAVNPDGWTKLGGWVGLVTAALAWYGSLAAVMNATAKRVVFPTFPR
jgi:CheY-like chemotaxis protein